MSLPSPDSAFTDSAQYQTVTASTPPACAPGGRAVGDYCAAETIIPSASNAAAISTKDSAASITIFKSGTLADLKPFFVPIGAVSVNGGWSVVTGAGATAIARGRFT